MPESRERTEEGVILSERRSSEVAGSDEGLEKNEGPIWPRITLVTPVMNSAGFLEQTIRSVLSQNYPNLDYFIVDGGSTDGSVDVIRKHEDQISGWMSEPDQGSYDALNKGFVRAIRRSSGLDQCRRLVAHQRTVRGRECVREVPGRGMDHRPADGI